MDQADLERLNKLHEIQGNAQKRLQQIGDALVKTYDAAMKKQSSPRAGLHPNH
jgi:hypothetical protein